MKKLTKIFYCTFLLFIFTFISFNLDSFQNISNSTFVYAQNSQQTSTELNSEDWKIVLDDEKDSNEFSFIQRNISSSDFADNGHFLLIIGIILIAVSIIGIIYFSMKLYKMSKKTTIKKSNNKGSRYK